MVLTKTQNDLKQSETSDNEQRTTGNDPTMIRNNFQRTRNNLKHLYIIRRINYGKQYLQDILQTTLTLVNLDWRVNL